RRPSVVIYPPVNIAKFNLSEKKGDYFFMAGRLVSYKRFDLAIRAFNKLNLPLKIVGTGPGSAKLRKIAKKNIEFLGLVSDQQLADLYANSKALVFPQEEDLGIVPLEAMASGKPVIAYGAGGALETVIDGQTGLFFNGQSEESIIDAIERFSKIKFDPRICRKRAEEFDIEVFKNKILEKLNEKV
ncbi:MAG: glycosyltransferase, partial [Bacteroidota bacterium]